MGFDLTAALPFVEEQVLQDGRGNATGEKFLWVDWVDGFDVVRNWATWSLNEYNDYNGY